MIKKAFKAIGILILVIIIAAIAIPYFFKDRIVKAVKTEINENVNAKVDFADVGLSLFKTFPDLNFSLDQLSVTGINEFDNYKLIEAENIEFSLNLMSVINNDKPIEINAISLQEPTINMKVLRNGKANYDIVKPSNEVATETSSQQTNFLIQLQKYEITDGNIVYDDRLGGTYLEVQDLNHVGKGEFTQDVFDLTTTTEIASLTAKSGGVTYLSKAKGDLDLTLIADITNSKFTIKKNSLILNALKLNMDGFVQLVDNKINVDIKYDAPKNNFKNLLSMIPSAYTADFNDVEANGKLILDGFVKGSYDINTGDLPAFLLNLKVENADFKYPDLPLGIKGINTTTVINSPSSNLNKMVVDISNFKMELGDNPFEAKAKLWTLISDPNIDSEIKGKINLTELAKAFPLEGVKQLNGTIISNLKANTSMSAIDSQDYENVDMAGDLRIENLDYQTDDFPQIKIADMRMVFSPNHVKLDNFDAQLGKSDVKAEGKIDNILAYFSPEKTMTGNLKVRSNFVDANEWISEEETTQPNISAEEAYSDEVVFDRFDFSMDGEIKKMAYDVYDMRDSKFVGKLTPNKAIINKLETKIGDSDFSMNGKLTNIFNYIFENEILQGDIYLNSNYINANEFMVEEGQVTQNSAEEGLAVMPVPEKMDLNINADITEVLYTNIPLRNIKGKIKIADEEAIIQDANAKTLGGNITMNGSYNTQDIEEPKFNMDYKVHSLNYEEAFNTLNTFQALAPIGKFIEGKFNTSFKMSGKLGKDMMPILNSLSADGILETIDGSLRSFKPLEEFGDKLNLNFLKSIDIKNTKNWFEFNDGQIKVKDFDYSSNGIDMVIGGTHGLDTEMTYHINAKVPRKLLQENAVGQVADKGLSLLQGQASKLGIDIDKSEFVNVKAIITGTMTNPKIKLSLLGSDGIAPSVNEVVEVIKDKAVEKVSDIIEDKTGVDVTNIKEEVAEVKEDFSAKADAEIEALMKKTKSNIDKVTSEAEKRANQTKAEAKQLSDKARTEGYKQADALIEKAGGNIFKKKAAEIAAKKLKQTTDEKADEIIVKGDLTAKEIIDTAKKQTDKLQTGADKQAQDIRKKYK